MACLPLADILQRQQLVTEEAVAEAYAAHYDLKYVTIDPDRGVAQGWALSLPENVARCKSMVVLGEAGDDLVAAVADPGDPTVRHVLEQRYQRAIRLVVSPRSRIAALQNKIYVESRERGVSQAEAPTRIAAPRAAVRKAAMSAVEEVDSILDEAVDRRASDVHIEPEESWSDSDASDETLRLRIRLRIDGRLIESRALPMSLAPSLVSRIKVLARLDISDKRSAQDGRFVHKSFGKDIDVRVAILPTVLGERVTIRILGMDRERMELTSLGMDVGARQLFEELIQRPYGIMLITGPTGSGKTTTMYTALESINTVDKHIITVENPVEYHLPGINQIQVDAENEVTFASALRSIVRHDPDVIMVGEIRDRDTAHLALEASLTGHLVFATLHTNSSSGGLARLMDMGCEPFLVASGVIGVLAQRLVRRLCEHCKQPYSATDAERRLMNLPEEQTNVELFHSRGCTQCNQTGYHDRVGIFELLRFDSSIAELVMEKSPAEAIQVRAIERGLRSLRDDALAKALAGLTTVEEAVRVTTISTQ
jgi:type II secretory ATPase GspE/PulE/Tfp pilus assembly ATPase PilB-like protein